MAGLGRWQFADQLMRQNHLVIDGWLVLRFAYDDLAEKPRRCQQVLQQLLGKWHGGGGILSVNHDSRPGKVGLHMQKFNSMERDIIRLALRDGTVSVARASQTIGMSTGKTRRILLALMSKGLLVPSTPNQKRTHSYKLSHSSEHQFI
ncbi:hypothetical protein [Paenibacillus sp. sptzw28]|uniref:hypothetical protein n=1 Tax=Paenibacillus sp. sptzw28 TaxID=715179 RepID=UPI002162947F|nr:hypothetical protein [Paenibacillus sp. sptzw28]